MRNYAYLVIAAILFSAYACPAQAEVEAVRPDAKAVQQPTPPAQPQPQGMAVPAALPEQKCEPVQAANINIEFRTVKQDISRLSADMEAMVKQVKDAGGKAGVTDLEKTAMNYNMRQNSRRNNGDWSAGEGEGDYRITGRMAFTTKLIDKAPALVAALKDNKEFQTSLDVRMFNRCNGFSPGMGY